MPDSLISTSEAVKLTGASDSTIRRMIGAGELKATRKKRGKRTYVYIGRDEVLALFGARKPPDGGPGSQVIDRERGAAGATEGATMVASPGATNGTVAVLQERAGHLEAEKARLRDDLDRTRRELEEARADVRQVNAEMRAALTGPKPGALVRLVRGVRDVAGELRGTTR